MSLEVLGFREFCRRTSREIIGYSHLCVNNGDNRIIPGKPELRDKKYYCTNCKEEINYKPAL